MTHHLTERDLDRRIATCSVDGPVKIRRSGTGWVCAEKAKANVRAYKNRHPERDRSSKSDHQLTEKDPPTRLARCSVCGVVDMVPTGRGWACATRAKELGRVNHQDAPQTWCRDCWAEMEGDADRYRVWLLADGTCPRCSTGQDLHAELRDLEHNRRVLDDAGLGPGFHIVSPDPYAMPDYESAVPGWHTLGSRT
jgi:hypothetical protein